LAADKLALQEKEEADARAENERLRVLEEASIANEKAEAAIIE